MRCWASICSSCFRNGNQELLFFLSFSVQEAPVCSPVGRTSDNPIGRAKVASQHSALDRSRLHRTAGRLWKKKASVVKTVSQPVGFFWPWIQTNWNTCLWLCKCRAPPPFVLYSHFPSFRKWTETADGQSIKVFIKFMKYRELKSLHLCAKWADGRTSL